MKGLVVPAAAGFFTSRTAEARFQNALDIRSQQRDRAGHDDNILDHQASGSAQVGEAVVLSLIHI